MFKSARVFLGRSWRYANRKISRFYLRMVSPMVQVDGLVRLGSDYGGWYAPADMPKGALCYCIGVGRDATFDFELGRRGADVYSLDPTPMSVDYMKEHADENVSFRPWGLWKKDKVMRFYAPLREDHASHFINDLHSTGRYHEVPCYRLDTIKEKLGHEGEIFLLKMDIEGAWYETLLEFVPGGNRPKYLGVEFDSPAPIWRVARVLSMLKKFGYKVAVIEKDNVTFCLAD